MGTTREIAGFAEDHSDAKDRACTSHVGHKQFEVADPALTVKQLRNLLSAACSFSRHHTPSSRGGRAVDAACP
jgi:hypothetical protein